MKPKPCPGCGSDNVVLWPSEEYPSGPVLHACVCLDCDLMGTAYSGTWVGAEARAISHWNAYDHRV